MTKQDFLDAFKAIFSTKEEEVKVEEIETQSEEVTEVTEPVLNIDALKEALTETLAQFSKDQDEKLEALRVEFSKVVEEKDEQINKLNVELSKEPEVKPIKANPEPKKEAIYKIGANRPMSTQDRVFAKLFS
jgi:uncharacterized membrane protein YhiD involved in acid resistance